jgi:hypothetical protein
MGISRTLRRKALWIRLLLVALLAGGCAGIKPYEPRDYRQEGPERGLFTGSQGEWVILGPKAPQKDRQEKNKKNILRELRASNERSEWALRQNNNMSLLSHSED